MSPFHKKMSEEIDNQMESEFLKYQSHNQRSQEDQQRLQQLLISADELHKEVRIRIPNLTKEDLSIDKHNLHSEMEKTMVMHSNIIDDIFQVKSVIEKMKVLLNGVVGILYHNLKFKNQYNLKTAKDVETYLAQEPAYNAINVRIKELQNFVERSSEFSGMIKQKIGFIRDLTKLRTQEIFSEK